MPSLVLTLDLKPDPVAITAYRQAHAAVWPEVLLALRAVGVLNMRIWLRGNRLMMLAEVTDGFDPAVDFPRYLTLHPRCQAWETWMGSLQQALPDAPQGEMWQAMELVFDMEAQWPPEG